jgi:hypothetical protein
MWIGGVHFNIELLTLGEIVHAQPLWSGMVHRLASRPAWFTSVEMTSMPAFAAAT